MSFPKQSYALENTAHFNFEVENVTTFEQDVRIRLISRGYLSIHSFVRERIPGSSANFEMCRVASDTAAR